MAKYTLLLPILLLFQFSFAQNPGFGTGTSPLVVPAGTEKKLGERRAFGEFFGLANAKFEFKDRVGPYFDATRPFAMFVSENPYAWSGVTFIYPTAIVYDPVDDTKGTIDFTYMGNTSGTGNIYTIVQLDQFSSAQIDGTLTTDPYDPAVKHGGSLFVLIDGDMTFGPNGIIDVSGKGIPGGVAGTGGSAASHSGAGAAAPTALNQNGIDATLTGRLVSGLTTGEKLKNVKTSCESSGELEGLQAGKGTSQILGGSGTGGTSAFQPIMDNLISYTPSTGGGGVFTMGGGGKGGNGGWRGASAGGNGGSGATNGAFGGSTNNTGPEAGPGLIGTGPVALNGQPDAGAGDGGKGGNGGGAVFIRARNFYCNSGTIHFKANGQDGLGGEDGHGQGGDGGSGGKGADGRCSTDASESEMEPAGGNGGRGIGGNGADGGNGGNPGEGGTIWIWYETGASSIPSINNCEIEHGEPGNGTLGGLKGDGASSFQAATVSGVNCDCEGDPEPRTALSGSYCACFENFEKLKGMSPDGTTVDGDKKWSDANGNYCYYNATTDQLVCYEETVPVPFYTIKRTTYCGEFDCSWVKGAFDELHTSDPVITLEGGEANWTANGTDYNFDFKTGALSDGSFDCTKSCDPAQATTNDGERGPRDGMKGKKGAPRTTPKREAKLNSMTDQLPPPVVGLSKPFDQDALTLFPNPATHVLTVEFKTKSQRQIYVLNSLGQVLWQTPNKQNRVAIDLSQMASGSYLLKVVDSTRVSVLPFEKR